MIFETVFERVLGNEGNYVNSLDDLGGETNWGISKRSYPNLDIKNLTKEQAFFIYKRDFWERLPIGLVDDEVIYQLFDFAVNSGIEVAIRYYQRALDVADDGYIGPVTIFAIKNVLPTDQIMLLNAERLNYMTRLKNWPIDGKGWARRIANNLRLGALDS